MGAVKADRGQIEQVIVNLAVNARDAMPRGGKLTHRDPERRAGPSLRQPAPGRQRGPYVVMLAVTDTGIGMDAATSGENLRAVLHDQGAPARAPAWVSPRYTASSSRAAAHLVYSEPGRGTTFKIYLPRVTARSRASRVRQTAQRAGGQKRCWSWRTRPEFGR